MRAGPRDPRPSCRSPCSLPCGGPTSETYASGASGTMGSTPHRLPESRPTARSAPEATVATGIRPQCAQEVHVAEVRPVRLAEVELGGGALPEQEAAEPLLARGADDEVGVGLALGVEVLGDVVDRELGGDLLDRLALGGPGQEQVTHGVGDLAPPAV